MDNYTDIFRPCSKSRKFSGFACHLAVLASQTSQMPRVPRFQQDNNTAATVGPYQLRRVISTQHVEQMVLRKLIRESFAFLLGLVESADLPFYGINAYSVKDILLVWLYHLMFRASYSRIELLTHLPHSNMKQWFGLIRSVLHRWGKEYITINDRQEREQAAREVVRDERFRSCTVIIDGTHVPVANRKENERDLGYSFKLKKNGRTFQVAVNQFSRIIWVSSGFPANCADISCLRSTTSDFIAAVGFDVQHETLMLDGGYKGFEYCHTVTPIRKPKRGFFLLPKPRIIVLSIL